MVKLQESVIPSNNGIEEYSNQDLQNPFVLNFEINCFHIRQLPIYGVSQTPIHLQLIFQNMVDTNMMKEKLSPQLYRLKLMTLPDPTFSSESNVKYEGQPQYEFECNLHGLSRFMLINNHILLVEIIVISEKPTNYTQQNLNSNNLSGYSNNRNAYWPFLGVQKVANNKVSGLLVLCGTQARQLAVTLDKVKKELDTLLFSQIVTKIHKKLVAKNLITPSYNKKDDARKESGLESNQIFDAIFEKMSTNYFDHYPNSMANQPLTQNNQNFINTVVNTNCGGDSESGYCSNCGEVLLSNSNNFNNTASKKGNVKEISDIKRLSAANEHTSLSFSSRKDTMLSVSNKTSQTSSIEVKSIVASDCCQMSSTENIWKSKTQEWLNKSFSHESPNNVNLESQQTENDIQKRLSSNSSIYVEMRTKPSNGPLTPQEKIIKSHTIDFSEVERSSQELENNLKFLETITKELDEDYFFSLNKPITDNSSIAKNNFNIIPAETESVGKDILENINILPFMPTNLISEQNKFAEQKIRAKFTDSLNDCIGDMFDENNFYGCDNTDLYDNLTLVNTNKVSLQTTKNTTIKTNKIFSFSMSRLPKPKPVFKNTLSTSHINNNSLNGNQNILSHENDKKSWHSTLSHWISPNRKQAMNQKAPHTEIHQTLNNSTKTTMKSINFNKEKLSSHSRLEQANFPSIFYNSMPRNFSNQNYSTQNNIDGLFLDNNQHNKRKYQLLKRNLEGCGGESPVLVNKQLSHNHTINGSQTLKPHLRKTVENYKANNGQRMSQLSHNSTNFARNLSNMNGIKDDDRYVNENFSIYATMKRYPNTNSFASHNIKIKTNAPRVNTNKPMNNKIKITRIDENPNEYLYEL